MTTEEASELIRDAVVDEAGGPAGSFWADLGAGSGTFTFALAELLGAEGRVVAVDREHAAVESLRRGLISRGDASNGGTGRRPTPDSAVVVAARGDFREPSTISELRYAALDGALFANSLHFDPDPAATLRRVTDALASAGRIVVVEYQDRPPNPWVPHPLPVDRLEDLAAAEGLGTPRVVGERPSSYGGVLYCAWLEVP